MRYFMDDKNFKIKKCYTCRFYNPYFTRGDLQFIKTKFGECRLQEGKIVKHTDECEDWVRKLPPNKKKFDELNVQESLTRALVNITEIRQIFEKYE